MSTETHKPEAHRPEAHRVRAHGTDADRPDAHGREAHRPEARGPEARGPEVHRSEAHSVVLDAIRALTFATEREQHRVADAAGIATSDMLALSHLRASGPLSQSELAGRLSMAPSSVTTLVDRLERHGLAARKADPADRRKSLVGITDSGTACAHRIREHFAAGLRSIPDADVTAIAAALTQLVSAFEGNLGRPSAANGPAA